jgi:hypothetical protein
MTEAPYIPALRPLVDSFVALGIAYHIGGSVATTVYGLTRTTLDVDIIVDLRVEHVSPLIQRLAGKYYLDEDMIREAIRLRSSFNLIHLGSMYKVDVFVLKQTPYDQQSFMRADVRSLDDSPDDEVFFVEAAEDVILNKLRWYRLGGETSERQWSDILGMLRVQMDALDVAYLQHWSTELGVADLLARAFKATGLAQ